MPSALAYIGGVNRGIGYVANAAAEGIAAYEIDLESGASRTLGVTRGIDNPTYLALSPDGDTLVAVSEVDGWHEGVVSCYRVDPSNGALRYSNKQPTRGDYTCHTGYDPTGRFVGVANYGGMPVTELPNRSFALYQVEKELSPPCAQITHVGQGVDAIRQSRPHAHCVRWSPDGRFLIVSDLGIDRLMVYRFDAISGTVEPHGEVALAPGAGPRHVLFHPSLPVLYCVNELDGTLVTLAFDAALGNLRPLATASTLPDAGCSGNACSALAISQAGDHVYVGNRGHDSVACLVTDSVTGIASFQSTTPSGGSVPRDIVFDPSGTMLAVANQESDHVALFRRDASTGALSALGPGIDVGSPTVVAFHPKLR